eukprot:TRINITY_DN6929_c0_g2_i3.p2 TRINITY_DN6929_c0_g2~~TRINITY_DN6929_c0_g2_i3.p2  ORF type:complete len:128 (+),score=1.35 TRINITY_DN6929_c0_g2_i3:218-601(+)
MDKLQVIKPFAFVRERTIKYLNKVIYYSPTQFRYYNQLQQKDSSNWHFTLINSLIGLLIELQRRNIKQITLSTNNNYGNYYLNPPPPKKVNEKGAFVFQSACMENTFHFHIYIVPKLRKKQLMKQSD